MVAKDVPGWGAWTNSAHHYTWLLLYEVWVCRHTFFTYESNFILFVWEKDPRIVLTGFYGQNNDFWDQIVASIPKKIENIAKSHNFFTKYAYVATNITTKSNMGTQLTNICSIPFLNGEFAEKYSLNGKGFV